MKKKRRKRTKRLYFTKVHEEAIIKYTLTNDRHERDVLYGTLIQPAFNEMVNKIIYTYKFNSLPNIENLSEECQIWLTTILNKFDPAKGHKAFSYFSVITKNWFIQKVKKNSKRLKREINCEDVYNQIENEQFVTKNHYEDDREQREFWLALRSEIEGWKKLQLKEIEVKTILAIEDLIANIDNIEIFNKKAIYLYLREISGLNTKQLVASLSSIKKRYREFKQEWVNGDEKWR
mgnify:CR=1 FL=1|jgi:DNA-directed RNA polymerase specialized sigma subunit|tara:strand:- start:25667 stop:26368 length:702 start_codon:yes stop_codon:yes gene_type:complete